MRHIRGGVFVGLLVAGLVSALTTAIMPPVVRRAWVVWLIASFCIAVAVYVAARVTKTPPE